MAAIHVDVYAKCGDLSAFDVCYFGLRWSRWKDRRVASLIEITRRICAFKQTQVRQFVIENMELLPHYTNSQLDCVEGFQPGAVLTAIVCDASKCTCDGPRMSSYVAGDIEGGEQGEGVKRKRGRPKGSVTKKRAMAAAIEGGAPADVASGEGGEGETGGEGGDNTEPGTPSKEGTLVGKDRSGRKKVVLCPHGQVRSFCVACGGKPPCPHGRQPYLCPDCGGKGICVHRRQRHKCKDCGGSSVCVHKKLRYNCPDCSSVGMCEHGKIKNKCKDCLHSMCDHGLVRLECEECRGSLCEHGKRKDKCRICNPPLVGFGGKGPAGVEFGSMS
eukprot:comp22970_c0_seq1/m.36498 comp22970_c0_seq1/g.36498  ORF comp22970_c0_seq1/g.36498 comp22970_c0_seq1/m.36498 type:complete len:330 (-) comp22970_c0_seq1:225-1214(-)